ncbi:MAG: hypothetical protein JWR19_391 [Pedosphaera sp.]|jgi:hypothetical protein|nr:hypothetical protein [Pedosphaera sp.]
MIIKKWWVTGLVLDFVAFAVLQEDRDKKWYYRVWLSLIGIAVVGSLFFLYASISAFDVPSGEAGGFMGLGLLIMAFNCLPYLALLFLCLNYRPQQGKK